MERTNDDNGLDAVAGGEADVADVLEQSEPLDGEPVEAVLAGRERIVPGDPVEDRRERDDAREAAGEP